MPDQLQLRGGTTTEHNSFTGAAREVTVDTTKKTLVVHDGSQAGGTPLMRENGGNAASSVQIGSGGVNALTIDGSQDITLTGASANVVWDKSNNALEFADSAKALFGTSSDLEIIHNGTNSVIDNSTGTLFVQADTIRFTGQGNSENIAQFIKNADVKLYYNNVQKFATTSSGVTVTGDLRIANDLDYIGFGTDNDLQIRFDGTNSKINNSTGFFLVETDSYAVKDQTSNEFYIKAVKDGAVELYHSGSKKFETTASGVQILSAGTSPTLNIEQQQDADSEAIKIRQFGNQNQAATIMSFLNWAGSEFGSIESAQGGAVSYTTHDNGKFMAGNADDLQIFHNGTSSYISNTTGNLYITATSTETAIQIIPNGAVDLRHDGSKKFETLTNGIKVHGNIFIDDNDEIRLGDSGDFQLFHNSSTGEARIFNSNAAGINIITDLFNVKNNANNETLLKATNGGAVKLYYDGSTQPKAQTVSAGFAVGGKLFTSRTDTGSNTDYASFKVSFFQQIAASGSHTFQVGSVYAMGTVTTFGSRGPSASNATLATGKIFPIHVRAGATAGLGSQIGSDLGGASGGFSYTVAAASQGITVTNGSSTYAINVFVSFDLTGFVS